VVLAALLATLANPYGWHMWQFVFGVAHLTRDIMEWQPLSAAPLFNRAAIIACVVAVLVLWRRLPFDRVASVLGLGYAALRAIKFDSLCVATTALFLSPLVVSRFPRSASDVQQVPFGLRVINGAAVAAILGFTMVHIGPRVACMPSAEWRPDPTAAAALANAKPSGRIVVTFDWGEYVIWQHGPQLRVSFDPRFDLVYSSQTIAEQSAVYEAEPAGIAFLERSRPEYVWFRQSEQALKNWLTNHGYRLDVDTPDSFIAVRSDLPRLLTPSPQEPGCFPAP
jgi:hypothetical protein